MNKYYPPREPKKTERIYKGIEHCVIPVCECDHYSCDHEITFISCFTSRSGLAHCGKCMCPKFKRDHDYEFDLNKWEYKEVKE